MIGPPPRSPLFPYTTLFRSGVRHRPTRHGDLFALGIHALHVADVVAALDRIDVGVGVAAGDRRAAEEPDARAGGGTDRGIAGGRAEGRARGRADRGTDGGAGHHRVGRRLLGGDAGRVERPLAAGRVVCLELVEGVAWAGQLTLAGEPWD